MSQLTPNDLESLLREYGWTFEPSGDNQWLTGFQGHSQLFPLTIRLNHTCVSFEVMPLVDATVDLGHLPHLSRELLELNARLQLVKVGVSPEGEIGLSCQILSQGFDIDTLTRTLGILGYYADELGPDLAAKIVSVEHSDRPAWLS